MADPLIRGSAVLVGAAWVTAPLPAGRASTVASDASAAAASVQSAPIFRVVRIACPFVESDDTGLARIDRLEPPPYGSFTRLTNRSSESGARAGGTLVPWPDSPSEACACAPVRSTTSRFGSCSTRSSSVARRTTRRLPRPRRSWSSSERRPAISTACVSPRGSTDRACAASRRRASRSTSTPRSTRRPTPPRTRSWRSEYVADGELDVGAWARDQVALGLPDQILCRPDCAGLCPFCGKDLNVEPHEHAEEAVDPRWAALERLRTEHGA